MLVHVIINAPWIHNLQCKGVNNFCDTCSRHNNKSKMYQLWEPEMHKIIICHKSILHRDANLWKSKIWRLSLWHLLYEVLHEVQTITNRSYDCNGKIIFVIDEICAKMPQKLNYESEKIQILGENGITSKLKHRKAHNWILSGRFGDLYRRPWDWWLIRDSWYACMTTCSTC